MRRDDPNDRESELFSQQDEYGTVPAIRPRKRRPWLKFLALLGLLLIVLVMCSVVL
jgi:hypothetical protein